MPYNLPLLPLIGGFLFIHLTHFFRFGAPLDSRKWYVGWMVRSPNLDPREFYFRILPFISGYRDKDTLQTFRLVFYQDVLQNTSLDPEQFYITLPLKDVKIAGLFNDDVFNEYFTKPDSSNDPV